MNAADWFEIECVDGTSATIYLNGGLADSRMAEIRDACDALPPSVRVLRVQLMISSDVEALPLSIGAVLRHWRQMRHRAFHLVIPDNRRSGEVPRDAGENGDQLPNEHVSRVVDAKKYPRRANQKGNRNQRRRKGWKGHRVAEGDGHGRGRVPRGK
jgi:hypothetical protein